jgi:hypothetical protein
MEFNAFISIANIYAIITMCEKWRAYFEIFVMTHRIPEYPYGECHFIDLVCFRVKKCLILYLIILFSVIIISLCRWNSYITDLPVSLSCIIISSLPHFKCSLADLILSQEMSLIFYCSVSYHWKIAGHRIPQYQTPTIVKNNESA